MQQEYAIPDGISGKDIRNMRKRLNLTVKELAALVNVSPKTVEHWEAAATPVHGPICLVYRLLFDSADAAWKLRIPPASAPLRLIYRFRSMVCSIIDVDEVARRVSVVNYTSLPQFRAFGRETEPGFEDYEAFLESRCFSREMDKRKLMLEELNLPYYDPLLIIEKTQGRMEEDEFWIEVKRI